ncbi:MAG: arginyltransferase [Rhodospirillales bacterium]
MRHNRVQSLHHFFTTAPLPCPYLPNRTERRIVTELTGRDPQAFHDALSRAGFRRSHNIAYAPACEACNACVPMRVVCQDFRPSKNQKRVIAANRDLCREERDAIGTAEQYRLFADYQARRHAGGEMSNMTHTDYQALVEDTPVESHIVEYREPGDGRLVAVCLTDRLSDGHSAVYSFFDPVSPRLSLGTYMILSAIQEAAADSLEFLYLGFWIADCDKMAYKSRFTPAEVFRNGSWEMFDPDAH